MMYFKDKFDLDVVNKLVEITLSDLSTASDDEKKKILRSIIINSFCDGSDITRDEFEQMINE